MNLMPRNPRTPILPLTEAPPIVPPSGPAPLRDLRGQYEHLPFGKHIASVERDDALEANAKALVFASLRDDPLLRFHARGQIDDAQFEAGRAMQELFDAAEISNLKAIDTTRENVDGGQLAEMLNVRRMEAADRLSKYPNGLRYKLGTEGYALCRAVLAERKFLIHIAVERGHVDERGKPQARAVNYLFRRLKECLDTLAFELNLATKAKA